MTSGTGIDLHTHSTASDGTVAPDDLVREAADAGLSVIALTDHDSFGGIAAAAQALPSGLMLVPGVEISCFVVEGDQRISLHLLGYLPDPEHPGLASALSGLRDARAARGEKVLAMLRADGYDQLTPEVLARVAGSAPVGRPHLASALVEVGLAADLSEAFGPRWVGRDGPYRIPKDDLPVLAAVRLVRAAGGVPVFAHPGAHTRGPTVSDETIAAMAGAGLGGLEVDHTDHDEQARRRLRGVAGELALLTTGSSDFHGTRKPARLGAETTSPAVLEALLDQAQGQPLLG